MGETRSGSEWTEEEKILVMELYGTGMTYKEIGDEIGRSVYSVASMVGNLNRVYGKHRIRWTQDLKLELLQMRDEGASITEIAEHYGISEGAAAKNLRRFNDELEYMGIRRYRPAADEEWPPLTDLPKWPGKQCGYCPGFLKPKLMKDGSIEGKCGMQGGIPMKRDAFCTAEKRPRQNKEVYPVLEGGKVVIHR